MLGATLAQAKHNTWIAYNANHHPIFSAGTPPQMWRSITQDQYIAAIDAGFFSGHIYDRFMYERLIYFHDVPINTDEDVDYPLFHFREWFNFQDTFNTWFHTTRPGIQCFRKLFEAAPPNGMLLG